MTTFTPAEREWYILTATCADDAGYLLWDIGENAATLYRYAEVRPRERRVAKYAAKFAASGRFQDLGCGHAFMPKVVNWPRGGGRDTSCRAAHKRCEGIDSESTQNQPESTPVDSDQSDRPILSYPILSKGKENTPTTRTHARGQNGRIEKISGSKEWQALGQKLASNRKPLAIRKRNSQT